MNTSSSSQERILVVLTAIDENPYQVRTVYDESMLTALATSIKDVGLLQVPVARKVGERYQLGFGHRRKKAFEKLWLNGLEQYAQMPLDVMDLTDREMFEISLTENLKRLDLSPIEKATALKRYMEEFHATSAEAAQLFGMRNSTVRGHVRLLDLPEETKQKVHAGELSQRQARKVLEKPETVRKRDEPPEDGFDLRAQLLILFYGNVRFDVSDQLLYKKVKTLLEANQQLERQVEMMNGRKHERAKLNSGGQKMQHASLSSR